MPDIDPITREIVQNALAAAADEMALALYRTAYSTIVRDCLDFSTSLCNAGGEMIAQGVTIPLHLGSVPFAMATLLKKLRAASSPATCSSSTTPSTVACTSRTSSSSSRSTGRADG